MRERSIVVYNSDRVKAWSEESAAIRAKKEGLEKALSSAQRRYKTLDSVIAAQDSLIRENEQNLAKINIDTEDAVKEKKELQDQINHEIVERSTTENKMSEIKKNCEVIQYQINQLEQNALRYMAHIADAKIFLNSLQTSPKELCDQLIQAIYDCLKKYDTTHPRYQSIAVRKLMIDIPRQIQCIIASEEESKDISSDRRKYLLLCALVFDMFDRVKDGNQQDRILANQIQTLFNLLHLERDDFLPDDFFDDMDLPCMKFLSEFKSRYITVMFDSDDQQLEKQEKTIFEKCLKETRAALPGKSFHDEAKAVVDTIERLASDPRHKHDIRFYMTILRETRELSDNVARYEELAKMAERAPSTFKKTTGALLMAGGVTAGVIAASPARTSQSSMSATTVGVVAGLGTVSLVTGLCLFSRGMRGDLSKNMMNLVSAIKNLHARPLKRGMRYAQVLD